MPDAKGPPTIGYLVFDGPAMLHLIEHALEGDLTEKRPILLAALAGDLRLIMVFGSGPLPPCLFDPAQPPTVIWFFDINWPLPEALPQVREMLAWTADVVVHDGGGRAERYAAVVDKACDVRRVLLIETCRAQEATWLAATEAEAARRAPAAPLLLVVPKSFDDVPPAPQVLH